MDVWKQNLIKEGPMTKRIEQYSSPTHKILALLHPPHLPLFAAAACAASGFGVSGDADVRVPIRFGNPGGRI